MQKYGHELLVVWRKATDTPQTAVAAEVGSIVPTVSRWENQPPGAPPRHRPSAAEGVRLQRFTGGDVPAVSWGYEPEEIEALLRAAVDLTTSFGIAGAVSGARRDEAAEVAS